MTDMVRLPDAGDLIQEGPPANVMELLGRAVDRGVSVEAIERLVELEARMTARNAAKEFADALADFQSVCPLIQRTSTAQIVSKRTGKAFSYPYAELDEVARTIREPLHQRGFSYGWDSKMVAAGVLEVVCTLRHRNGHSQTATFTCTVDENDAISKPQQCASTLTFARRYSLIQVLGLTLTDPDPDGERQPPISDEDVQRVEDMIAACEDAGSPVDRKRFLAWLKVEKLEDLRPAQLDQAMRELKKRADKARGQ
jgi:hypothetical protein